MQPHDSHMCPRRLGKKWQPRLPISSNSRHWRLSSAAAASASRPGRWSRRGICKQLRERLSTALGRDIEDDHELLTRLGKAKYHTLTPGARFREQKRKPKRKPSTSHSDDELAGENDLSSRIIAEEEDLCSRIISEVHENLHDPPEEMESSSDEDLSHPPLVQDRRRDDELHALANDGMVVQPDSCEQGGAGSSS